MRARLSALPASTREALALAPRWARLRGGAGTGRRCRSSARTGIAAQLIEREARIDSLHASAAVVCLYQDLGAERQGSTNGLRPSSTTRCARARHLAVATDSADAASSGCSKTPRNWRPSRGAAALAAELTEQALRLTPATKANPVDATLAAARAHLAAGEWTRARAIVTELVAEVESGALRAEALLVLAEFEARRPRRAGAGRGARVGGARIRRSRPGSAPACVGERFRTSYAAALQSTRVALELAEGLEDDACVSKRSSSSACCAAWSATRHSRFTRTARAISRRRRVTRSSCGKPTFSPPTCSGAAGDIDAARAGLELVHAPGRVATRCSQPNCAGYSRGSSSRAGRWEHAAEHATEPARSACSTASR